MRKSFVTSSVEDARFIHINFRLLAELECFEKVVPNCPFASSVILL